MFTAACAACAATKAQQAPQLPWPMNVGAAMIGARKGLSEDAQFSFEGGASRNVRFASEVCRSLGDDSDAPASEPAEAGPPTRDSLKMLR